jgi:glucose/arabinose dehydrogenase
VGGASGATGYCYGAAQPVVVMAKAGVGKVKTSTRFTVLLVGMVVAALTAALAGSVTPVHSVPLLPQGFTDSPVVSGLTNPTDMEFAPDGRLFVTEDAGRVRIVKPDGTLATFLDISTKVDSLGERGLLALTFDPGFSTNHYVYLHYTRKATSTTPPHNRIVRVTASANKAVAGSEKLIFRLGNQSATNQFPQFMGGALDFGTDGKLYVVTGDNDTPGKAQKLNNLFGKMLRMNESGTIPTDNPFYSTASGQNRAIWALGLRNPFKFAIQPGTGTTTPDTIFINDVGENTWEEINQGAPGANYGWPVHEGEANDPPYVDPIFLYGHGSTDTTGCAITGGAFYNPATLQFPQEEYEGDYFFADFCGGWIRRLEQTPPPGGGFTASGFATGLQRPIDLEVSQAGELYYLSRSTTGSPALVGKIGYAGN